ncbi:autotransporter outer membrane beta-barrel domain-containing protein [Sphingomonas sp. BK235]|uniref:autotransporter domain-containing protein n=1 Tax=Sphingomonas sp. BK235 TaxID=2512131 RepID=UPI00104C1AE5|nr:autotransporter outer membrane beta-barrel domain-containing protein [Sphingomonas sp. BK235]
MVESSARLRRWTLALGVSLAAMSAASSPAAAQCTPDPTASNGVTSCAGTDPDGLVVTTPGTQVTVAADAVVRAGPAAAIDVAANAVRLSVAGRVEGGAGAGLRVAAGAPYWAYCSDPYAGASLGYCSLGSYYMVYPSASATIDVAAGATVSGAQALRVALDPANRLGAVQVALTNAGTMTGSAGAAIVADLPADPGTYYTQLTVTNAAGGTIAGISGRVGRVTNDGTITAAGGVAIDAAGALSLTNRGTIRGAVIARDDTRQGSTIDNRLGTIDGDVTLGAGNDVFLARYVDGAVRTGVTGTIDGGAGVDTLRLDIDADATLAAVALPVNVERLGLEVARDVTATLGDGFAGPVQLGGAGTIVNRTVLTGASELITSGPLSLDTPAFVNAGTLRTTVGGAYAVQLNARSIDNQGTIEAAGDGVSLGVSGQSFSNSGSITAAGIAVSAWSVDFSNAGTITSTAGVGLALSGSYGYRATNSGTISGAVAGVRLGTALVNTGVISSPGTAVTLDWYGTIDNRAGGRISGGSAAIAPRDASGLYNATVVNAGTIDGDVLLGRDGRGDSYNGNRFFALAGGVLNGNLTLGRGDTLVAELAGSGAGRFAGITGTVTATDSLLRYRVRDAATVAADAAPAGFATIGYDLIGGAALTLTGARAPVSVAGEGSVDVGGDIVVGTAPAIAAGYALAAPGETAASAGALAVTSRGTLTLVRAAGVTAYPDVAVSLTERDTYTNAGTIVLGGAVSAARAGRVVNAGTIRQAEGSAASDGLSGAYNRLDVTNGGTIAVAGAAIRGNYYGMTVDNGGQLVSTATGAILGGGWSDTVFNRAGGTIQGAGVAVRLAGGTLSNAGTILGDVRLGFNDYGSSSGSAVYVAQGGTIAGDLRFGDGDDQFVSYGDATGVSGTIDAGGGTDTFVHARAASATVTLGAPLLASFEREGARATGADTVLTLRADAPLATDLALSGDATIVNTAAITGTITADSVALAPGGGVARLARLINRGDVTGLIAGTMDRFENEARLTATRGQPAVTLYTESTLDARNSGTITGGAVLTAGTFSFPYEAAGSPIGVSLVNTGTITGSGGAVQMSAQAYAPRDAALLLDNSGTISATGRGGIAAWLDDAAFAGGAHAVTVTNSGTIAANAGGFRYSAGFPPESSSYVATAAALRIDAGEAVAVSVTNAAGGVIEATGPWSTALTTRGTLALVNAGTIRGGAGETVEGYQSDGWGGALPFQYYLPGAIAAGDAADTIVNSGTILGSIALGGGDDRIDSSGRIEGDVFLGDGDDRMTLGGRFAGAVDGGAGVDAITVTGGTAAAPVAFTRLSDVEQLAVSGGYATIAGAATLQRLELSGGRLVGLAGSTLTAPRITVARDATFGSAGVVNADLAVAGTLSPGASPGTMTVNGNVALAGSATALFELTPTVSDRLVVNGALSIAPGATLQLVAAAPLRAGTSYALIDASGGVSGGFTTVRLPDDQPGLLLQDAGSLRLLAQFAGAAGFAPQVAASVDYVNAAIAAAPRDAALLAALPALLTDAGTSDARAFARLTPEAYASATQLGVDQALSLAQVARGAAFATDRTDAGAFTFAQTIGQWHRLGGDAARGTSAARAHGYGFLGGIGYGDRGWMVGAFAGYLNGRQQIDSLGARTRADGAVAGLHARYAAPAGWGFSGSLLYDGGDARTDRTLPGTVAARARYGLHSWVSDVAVHHALAVGNDWTLRPRLGLTYVRTTRDGVEEAGASRFALRVARHRHVAGFVDAGLGLARDPDSAARFRPHVALGLRHQIEGRRVAALAGFADAPLALGALGASRAPVVGTAAAGIDYRLAGGVDLFSAASAQTGRGDHQETITTGVRLRF